MIIKLLALACFLLLVSATDEEGTKYLEEKSKEDGVVTLPSGLRYKILESGDGAFHPAENSPTVAHYEGTLIDGTVFDSSYARGSPATFAPNQVIKGWTEAMQLMVEGDVWELYIPSDLAYGERGSGPDIPPGSALVFKIEMIEIQGDKVPADAGFLADAGVDYPDASEGETASSSGVSFSASLNSAAAILGFTSWMGFLGLF